MSKVSTRPEATVRPIYSRVLDWLRVKANLAELDALDSRTLMDIGLNRNEFYAAADPATPFERGMTLHEVRLANQCESHRVPGPFTGTKCETDGI
jgi:uncharacterized protein YjiS (DUF1127 family)